MRGPRPWFTRYDRLQASVSLDSAGGAGVTLVLRSFGERQRDRQNDRSPKHIPPPIMSSRTRSGEGSRSRHSATPVRPVRDSHLPNGGARVLTLVRRNGRSEHCAASRSVGRVDGMQCSRNRRRPTICHPEPVRVRDLDLRLPWLTPPRKPRSRVSLEKPGF
jgi:hypothetical protein